jgi:ketosteroid isomerase-like protein
MTYRNNSFEADLLIINILFIFKEAVMKKLFACSLLFLFLFISNFASAQQWTDEQKDVLKTVQTYNDLIASNNWTEFYNYLDDSYCDWSYSQPAPRSKVDLIKLMNYWKTKVKEVSYIITPLKIWVNGNFAFVHYVYSEIYEMNDGKINEGKGRWTDILMKKDGKWLLVGAHGGEIK